jgi:hypothetical protein
MVRRVLRHQKQTLQTLDAPNASLFSDLLKDLRPALTPWPAAICFAEVGVVVTAADNSRVIPAWMAEAAVIAGPLFLSKSPGRSPRPPPAVCDGFAFK